MKLTLCIVLGAVIAVTAGYGLLHDLTCYKIVTPTTEYVQADSGIIPRLGIANLGDLAENDFYIKSLAVDEATVDTSFADSTQVASIGPYPDSIEVDIPEWIPQGLCDEQESFRYYELIGVPCLAADEDRSNDTTRRFLVSLLGHDVGVIDMTVAEEPSEPPDMYYVGDTITVTATVENYGFHAEENIEVRMEVVDLDSNVLLWHNLQSIEFLDWRGNESGNPYITSITFPRYKIKVAHHQTIECRTELEGDMCPDDDEQVLRWIGAKDTSGIVKITATPAGYTLDVETGSAGRKFEIRYHVPVSVQVKIDILESTGRWVTSIVNETNQPGVHHARWDGCDARGLKVASGIYLVRMQVDASSYRADSDHESMNVIQKVVLLR